MVVYTVLWFGITLGQPGQGDYYGPIAASAQELAQQLDYFQRALYTIPGPPMGRGLYKQSDRIVYDLIYFQQQVQQKAAREMLYIAYDKVEQGLQTMLGDIKGLEKWDPALRMVAQQVTAANHD